MEFYNISLLNFYLESRINTFANEKYIQQVLSRTPKTEKSEVTSSHLPSHVGFIDHLCWDELGYSDQAHGGHRWLTSCCKDTRLDLKTPMKGGVLLRAIRDLGCLHSFGKKLGVGYDR